MQFSDFFLKSQEYCFAFHSTTLICQYRLDKDLLQSMFKFYAWVECHYHSIYQSVFSRKSCRSLRSHSCCCPWRKLARKVWSSVVSSTSEHFYAFNQGFGQLVRFNSSKILISCELIGHLPLIWLCCRSFQTLILNYRFLCAR